MLGNVISFQDLRVDDLMVPRADVTHLSTSRPIEENLALARQSGHTRFPLCERDLDSVIGLIHIKDLFRNPARISDIASLARPLKFVPETTPLKPPGTVGACTSRRRVKIERWRVWMRMLLPAEDTLTVIP